MHARRVEALRPRLAKPQLGAALGSALIINGHPLYRDALAQLLSPMLGGGGVRAAVSADEGLRVAHEIADLRLVILDASLIASRIGAGPGYGSAMSAVVGSRNGLATAGGSSRAGADAASGSMTSFICALGTACPDADIIVISASDERLDAMSALRAGAKRVISKAVSTQVLADTIHRALRGDFTGPRWITRSATGLVAPGQASLLTPRQLEVVTLLHLSNKEIGLRLGVTEITVKTHVSQLFRVLGVANRTQAVQALRRLSERAT
jgi:two-component system nitrate/nitrite response regulator NarL